MFDGLTRLALASEMILAMLVCDVPTVSASIPPGEVPGQGQLERGDRADEGRERRLAVQRRQRRAHRRVAA